MYRVGRRWGGGKASGIETACGIDSRQPDRAKLGDAINLGRWEGEGVSAMNAERDAARFV